MDPLYSLGMLATAAFAASGIVAALNTRIDLFGAVVVAVVTAIGGGTVRDLLLDVQVFWLKDPNWLWVATITGITVFVARERFDTQSNILAYLDAMGVGLFGAGAMLKGVNAGLPLSHAITMGLITAIGGGLIRDSLTGRDTLLVSPEIYASPIIAGLLVQAALLQIQWLSVDEAMVGGAITIIVGRSLAIRFGWQMPRAVINTPRH